MTLEKSQVSNIRLGFKLNGKWAEMKLLLEIHNKEEEVPEVAQWFHNTQEDHIHKEGLQEEFPVFDVCA